MADCRCKSVDVQSNGAGVCIACPCLHVSERLSVCVLVELEDLFFLQVTSIRQYVATCACLYELVIELLILLICSETLIHSGIKQVTVFLSESLK